MKTFKILAVLCVILIVSATNVKGQDNRTISSYDMQEVKLEIYCGDKFIDRISGTEIEAHMRNHYEDSDVIWTTWNLRGIVTSEKGVTFEISGFCKLWTYPIVTAHCNLKGDDGSHYVFSASCNIKTWEITFDKALCVGN
jgi:hypothetical protein